MLFNSRLSAAILLSLLAAHSVAAVPVGNAIAIPKDDAPTGTVASTASTSGAPASNPHGGSNSSSSSDPKAQEKKNSTTITVDGKQYRCKYKHPKAHGSQNSASPSGGGEAKGNDHQKRRNNHKKDGLVLWCKPADGAAGGSQASTSSGEPNKE